MCVSYHRQDLQGPHFPVQQRFTHRISYIQPMSCVPLTLLLQEHSIWFGKQTHQLVPRSLEPRRTLQRKIHDSWSMSSQCLISIPLASYRSVSLWSHTCCVKFNQPSNAHPLGHSSLYIPSLLDYYFHPGVPSHSFPGLTRTHHTEKRERHCTAWADWGQCTSKSTQDVVGWTAYLIYQLATALRFSCQWASIAL